MAADYMASVRLKEHDAYTRDYMPEELRAILFDKIFERSCMRGA